MNLVGLCIVVGLHYCDIGQFSKRFVSTWIDVVPQFRYHVSYPIDTAAGTPILASSRWNCAELRLTAIAPLEDTMIAFI